jgi:hypothetical protein
MLGCNRGAAPSKVSTGLLAGLARLVSGLKVCGRRRREQEISEGDQKGKMGQRFRNGVQGADRDMEGEPGEEQPPSPAVAQKQKDSADDGQHANKGDQNDSWFKRPFREVVDESYGTGDDEQAAEDGDE